MTSSQRPIGGSVLHTLDQTQRSLSARNCAAINQCMGITSLSTYILLLIYCQTQVIRVLALHNDRKAVKPDRIYSLQELLQQAGLACDSVIGYKKPDVAILCLPSKPIFRKYVVSGLVEKSQRHLKDLGSM